MRWAISERPVSRCEEHHRAAQVGGHVHGEPGEGGLAHGGAGGDGLVTAGLDLDRNARPYERAARGPAAATVSATRAVGTTRGRATMV